MRSASAAYGPEAALALLIPLGASGLAYIGPISTLIIVLLFVVYFSYRQTIAAYPHGGGSYTVAKENLGITAGLLAASALMLDYVLVVAVGISAGVGALISAAPGLQPYTLHLCLAILVLITIVNLRGVRESGLAFVAPTYLFVISLLAVLAIGIVKALLAGGHPRASRGRAATRRRNRDGDLVAPHALLRQRLHRDDRRRGDLQRRQRLPRARRHLRPPHPDRHHRSARCHARRHRLPLFRLPDRRLEENEPGYQSILSQLTAAVIGREGQWFYYVTIGSVLAVLALSANTGFADFPRLCRVIAMDGFLPSTFAHRGRRLVYSTGILVLAVLSALLLIVFNGITDQLIPLFAVGAFLAFTLSQAGMVAHWWREGGPHARTSMLINVGGAVSTGIALVIVAVSKFMEGAWIIILLIPSLMLLFYSVRSHYRAVGRELATTAPLDACNIHPPVVLLPIRGWSAITRKALRFALKISPDIYALHVAEDGEVMAELEDSWDSAGSGAGGGRRVSAAEIDDYLFAVPPALRPAQASGVRPAAQASGPRSGSHRARIGAVALVSLPLAQSRGGGHQSVPALQRLSPGGGD